jgi:hypothetical protein
LFDPFNSSSTGHQHAANVLAGSTSWRESRTYKLTNQLQDGSGRGGARHLADLVGAGSEGFGKNGRKANGRWEKGMEPKGKGERDIRGMMTGARKRGVEESEEGVGKRVQMGPAYSLDQERSMDSKGAVSTSQPQEKEPTTPSTSDTTPLPIFSSLTLYLNGSTLPLISDHKLKTLFVTHGGSVSLSLARRSVTHVVVGETGLAAGKIQKETRRVGGESVKYVTAQWVVDCVEQGRRMGEGAYMPEGLRVGGVGQRSVGEMFGKEGSG